MHRCLRIQEVLRHIFHDVLDHPFILGGSQERDWPSATSDATLARLARTCRTFTEAALDELWYFQPTLVPLVCCLPDDAIKAVNSQLVVTRDLNPADYDRIYYYSYRIIVFGQFRLDSVEDFRLAPHVTSILWSRKPNPGPLLPKLRHLYLPINDFFDQAVFPRLVVGDRLQTVKIRVNVDNFAMAFSLEAGGPYEHFPADFRSPIDIMQLCSGFQCLERLDTPFIQLSHSVLAHLAILPELTELNAWVTLLELTQFNSVRFPDVIYFPRLLKLSLATEDLAICSELFNRPGFSRLQSLKIVRRPEVGIWIIASFFHKLQNYLSHTPLEEVILCNADARWAPPLGNVSPFTPRSLEPLLSFPNISVLKVNLDGDIALDDGALRRIGESWPNLRVLRLFDQTMGTSSAVTIMEGLLPLITACPQLEELTLRVNFTDIPTFAQLGDVIPARNLRRLNTCTSTVTPGEPEKISNFLMVLFPVLASLTYGWWYPDLGAEGHVDSVELTAEEESYGECWEEVRIQLAPFTVIHPDPWREKLDFR